MRYFHIADKRNGYIGDRPVTSFELFERHAGEFVSRGHHIIPGHDVESARCIIIWQAMGQTAERWRTS